MKIKFGNRSLLLAGFFLTLTTNILGLNQYKQGIGNTSLSAKTKEISDTIKDIDGNVYHKITIGHHEWMRENLKTTKFNNGERILLVKVDASWGKLNTPGYCYYNNDSSNNKITYGALYNWYAVHTGKLCPKGWHVPSDEEWSILDSYLEMETTVYGGVNSHAGGKMKEADTLHWASPNTGANNSSGFTALPAGTRGGGSGTFRVIGNYTGWWSANEALPLHAWFRTISFASSALNRDFGYLESTGFSVRCLKDK